MVTMTRTTAVNSAPKPLIAALMLPSRFLRPRRPQEHARLRQRERQEHADHVERNQAVLIAAEHDDQTSPRRGSARRCRSRTTACRRGWRTAAACSDRARRSTPASGSRQMPCSPPGSGSTSSRPARRSRTGCGRRTRRAPAATRPSRFRSARSDRRAPGTVRPTNIVTPRPAISTSVLAAFFAGGSLNIGTPSATASTPVSAVQPFANAVSRRNVVINPVLKVGSGSVGSTGVTLPIMARTAPVTIRPSITAEKRVDRHAKQPRRFLQSAQVAGGQASPGSRGSARSCRREATETLT